MEPTITPINWTLCYRASEEEEWKELKTTDVKFKTTLPVYKESEVKGVGSFTTTISLSKKESKRLHKWCKRVVRKVILKEGIKGIFKR